MQVRESFAFSGGRVDESGPYPVIRGVLLCGPTSEHGYDYPPSAWTDEDIRAYEGIKSFEGHRDGQRFPSEMVGVFKNPRRRADGMPEADFHLEPDHPLTPRLIRAAKHDPSRFSFSQTAQVNFGTRGGRKVVEGFKRSAGRPLIHTVDVVNIGATTGGIFESAPTGPTARPAPGPVSGVEARLAQLRMRTLAADLQGVSAAAVGGRTARVRESGGDRPRSGVRQAADRARRFAREFQGA